MEDVSKPSEESEPPPQEKVERPLECGQCQKPTSVRYTEMVGKNCHTFVMCSDCPQLHQRLSGSHVKGSNEPPCGKGLDLTCGNCNSTLEAFKMGHPLGCSACYEVFNMLLLEELVSSNQVPKRLKGKKKGVPAHVGRAPGDVKEVSPSLRLIALNEALDETLHREDYEQAALIRDQIKQITEEDRSDTHE